MADTDLYRLPQPRLEGGASLNELLRQRRTVRAFAPGSLSLAELAELLWAAQGVTSAAGYRTAPSAGALYPLELRVLAGEVDGLPAGSYRYEPARHALRASGKGDLRAALAGAALDQRWLAGAPAVVVVCAVESRTTGKYAARGVRYVHMEAGHASQNLLLQAVSLGLAAATVGAFDDASVGRLLGLSGAERALAILPVGRGH